ncbi:unnamed protein product [Brassica oleracea]
MVCWYGRLLCLVCLEWYGFENGISVCGGRISFLAAEFKVWLLLCVKFNT